MVQNKGERQSTKPARDLAYWAKPTPKTRVKHLQRKPYNMPKRQKPLSNASRHKLVRFGAHSRAPHSMSAHMQIQLAPFATCNLMLPNRTPPNG